MSGASDDRSGGKYRKQRERRVPRPLDSAQLEALALHYVGRFATTRAKACDYLHRKVRERGWAGEQLADIAAVVERLADAGYIDDASFAEMKARSFARRGLGERRLTGALYVAGVAEADREGAVEIAVDERVNAAWRFAERKRLGPFAAAPITDRAAKDKALAAFMRNGHQAGLALRILALAPGTARESFDEE